MAATISGSEGKSVLITGAERGIGKALAHRFAAEGARVFLNTLSPVEACGNLLAEIVPSGKGDAHAFQADIRDPDAIRAMFQAVEAMYGGLDVMINNAGVESVVSALDLRVEEWDRIMNTNLRGAFLCAQQAARIMKPQGGGVIVNISSMHDSVPRLGTAHYCASKAGLTMLTKTLALEWAEYGIRVVGISPGAIETPINSSEIVKAGRANFEQWIPAGRLGMVEDIADAASFLASNAARYISGTTLTVDGAYSLNTIRYDPRKGTD